MTKRVVVIGGTGFLGRNISCSLRHAGFEVIPVARRPSTDLAVHYLDVARTSTADLIRFMDRLAPDLVVNAAGSLWSVDDSGSDDVALVHSLLEATTRVRLVHIGSTYEYGQHEGPASESTPTDSDTRYGELKARASEAVLKSGSNALVLRVSTVVGPHSPPRSLLGSTIRSVRGALRRGDGAVVVPPLYGCGDFLDARDLGAAVVRCADFPSAGQAFNIATGVQTPVSVVVRKLVDLGGSALRTVTRDDGRRPISRRGTASTSIDIGCAANVLGWVPTIDLDTTLNYFWRTEGDWT